MNWQMIRNKLLPPVVERRLFARRRRAEECARFAAFYRRFAGPGDLCFDVGANLGNRVRAFRAIGCRVVAVEPQGKCLAALRREFGGDGEVCIVGQALGAGPGTAVLRTSPDHVLSSLSDEFIGTTKASGRFAASEWSGREEVAVTTLDALIGEHGVPRFVKIDVEGFEAEVLAGLGRAVETVSFEWTPELAENARRSVARLSELGDYRFNVSWGESMRLAREAWWTRKEIMQVIDLMEGESQLFGDIYATCGEAGE